MKKTFGQLAISLSICFVLPQSSEGDSGNNNPTGLTGEYNGSITTAGGYDPYTGNGKRFVDDLTVTGSLGAYPLKWTRILNTRGGTSGFGCGGWSHNYQWGLWLRSAQQGGGSGNPYEGPDGAISYPDGRVITLYLEAEHDYRQYTRALDPMDRLQHVGNENYDLVMKDGGRVKFEHTAYGFVATTIVDPYGQQTRLGHDPSTGLLSTITEPAGRYLQINWLPISYPGDNGTVHLTLIDNVEVWDKPQGSRIETVHYHYDYEGVSNAGISSRYYRLFRVDYDVGPSANYTYFPAERAPGNYWFWTAGTVKTCDDPRYSGAMSKIEYEYTTTALTGLPRVNGEVKAEKNPTTPGQPALSTVTSPRYTPGQPLSYQRTETRADGATRVFEYGHNGDGELDSYTDFAKLEEVHHLTAIAYEQPDIDQPFSKIVTDARGHTTTTLKDPIAGAVLSVKVDNTPAVTYHYTDPQNPYYLESKTDERGKTTTYHRDGAQRIRWVEYPDGGVEEFTYDGNDFGLIHTHTMTSGGVEEFTYDARGLKQTYTPPWTPSDPDRHPTRYYYYDASNCQGHTSWIDRLWYVEDPLNHKTWYEYDDRGRMTRVTYDNGSGGPGSFTETYYNDNGTPAWTKDELQHKTSFEYDDYKRVTKVTNALFKPTISDYTPLTGLSPLSHTTASVYRLISPLGKVTENDYDSNFRRKGTTVGLGTNDAATTTYEYDEVGNLKRVKDPNGQATGKMTIYDYDGHNRRTKATDPLGHWTEWEYDDAGNVKSEKRMDGRHVDFPLYDEMNRLKQRKDEKDYFSEMEYDHAGNLKKQTDERKNVYYYDYDSLNRRTKMTYPRDEHGVPRHEDYLYDWAGRLFKYTNRSRRTQTFFYDQRNRQKDFTWDDGITSSQHTEYDEASRVKSITNSDSTISYTYYNDNRLNTEETFSPLSGDIHRITTYVYDDDGNRESVQYPGGAMFSYEYTKRNQLLYIKTGGHAIVTYGYDYNGNITTVARDNGTTTGQTPDDANRITAISHNLVGIPAKTLEYVYNEVNNIKAVRRDGGQGDGFEYNERREITGFNQNGDVNLQAGTVSNPANYMTLDFDASGDRTTIRNTNVAPGGYPYCNYSVNNLNQYSAISAASSAAPTPTPPATPTPPPTATPGGTPAPTPPPGQTPTPTPPAPPLQVAGPTFSPTGGNYYPNDSVPITIRTTTEGAQIRYTTDGTPPSRTVGTLIGSSGTINTGNRESLFLSAIAFKPGMTDSDVNDDNYYWDNGLIPDSGGRAGVAPPAYDLNGNVTSWNGATFTYDAQNRLTSATKGSHTALFHYDGKNRQIHRTIDGVVHFSVWDDWELIEEYDANNARQVSYLQGAHGVIKSWTDTVVIYYYQDSLGSTTHITDASGHLLESYRYDLYGKPSYFDSIGQSVNSSTYNINDLYAGERWMGELGLCDLRNRFMSPELGRFLQADPIGFKGDRSNLYRYCGNDPVNRSDPTGLTDLNYAGDARNKPAMDAINPTDAISVSAHGEPTKLLNNFWGDRTIKTDLPVRQVVEALQQLDKFKNNKDMPIRLYSCRAGDWRTAANSPEKECAAQKMARESGRHVQATGAWINPASRTLWKTDTCKDLSWYDFSPDGSKPTKIATPDGFRNGGLGTRSEDTLGRGGSSRDSGPVEPPAPLSQADWPDGPPSGSASTSGPPRNYNKSL